MKKVVALLIVTTMTTILFCSLWFHEVKDRAADMEQLCQHYAEEAAGHLSQYDNFKDVNDESYIGQYWCSVSVFYAFMETLYSLPDSGGWHKAMYKDCQVIYEHMLLAPDEILAHLDEVLAAVKSLGKDFDSPEARRACSQLSYNLQYMWK